MNKEKKYINFLDNYHQTISSEIDTILKGGETKNLFPNFIVNETTDNNNNSRAFLTDNSKKESIINTDFLDNFYFPKNNVDSDSKTYSNEKLVDTISIDDKKTEHNTSEENENNNNTSTNLDSTKEKTSIDLSNTSNISSEQKELVGGEIKLDLPNEDNKDIIDTEISIDLPSEIEIESITKDQKGGDIDTEISIDIPNEIEIESITNTQNNINTEISIDLPSEIEIESISKNQEGGNINTEIFIDSKYKSNHFIKQKYDNIYSRNVSPYTENI